MRVKKLVSLGNGMTVPHNLPQTQPIHQSNKSTLRSYMKRLLFQSVDKKSLREQSEHLCNRFINSVAFQNSQKIALYLSKPHSEVQTDALVEAVFKHKKQLFVPIFWQRSEMDMVEIKSYEEFLALPVNKWNIKEPNALPTDHFPNSLVDLVVMPGVAFDTHGNRLGQGKGYYDRYLHKCETLALLQGRNPPITVALALKEQIIPPPMAIPCDEWDKKPAILMSASSLDN